MKHSINIKTQSELGKINDLIHDEYFLWEDYKYDANSSTLTLEFDYSDYENTIEVKNYIISRKSIVPLHRGLIKIFHVTESTMKDGAQTGDNFLNVLTYDEKKQELNLSLCMDGKLTAKVHQLEVICEVSDQIIGEMDVHYNFFLIESVGERRYFKDYNGKLTKYQILINGSNFYLEMDGKVSPFGFYTTRLVEADSAHKAMEQAIALVQDELEAKSQNPLNNDPKIKIEGIHLIDHLGKSQISGSGFIYYSEDEEDAEGTEQ